MAGIITPLFNLASFISNVFWLMRQSYAGIGGKALHNASGDFHDSWILSKNISDRANPAGFALSPPGKVVILQDLHCPRWGKWLSCRICVVPTGESASPAGFALSPLGTAVIGADWKIPAHKIPVMLPFLMLPLHGMEIIFIFARTRFDR